MQTKSPQADSPAGFDVSDLSGRLVQAIAVRRHGSSMMVVMTVMAAALHLLTNLRVNPRACQPASSQRGEAPWISDSMRHPGQVRLALTLQQFNDPLIQSIAQFEALRRSRYIAHLCIDARA